MHISGPELLFPSTYVLSDRGIRESLGDDGVKLEDFDDSQIQPGSLDLRIGEVKVFDDSVRELMVDEMAVVGFPGVDRGPTDEHAIRYPDEFGIPIDLPPRSWAEIKPHETIRTEMMTRADLRSSRGRLGLKIETNQDGVLGIMNYNPNTVRLYGRTPFAQMFFHTEDNFGGRIVTDSQEAGMIGSALGVESFGPYLMFQLGEYAYRFRDVGVIDTAKKQEGLYDEVEIDNLVVPPLETIIVQLEPQIRLPPDTGIQLIDVPYLQNSGHMKPDVEMLFLESRRSNAGWGDPGYQGNLTAHLMRTKFPGKYNRGDNIVLGVITRYDQPVERSYGHPGLNSHYQGSTGSVSRS
jgi:deoxycytidine triphosphate deaminase